MYIPRRENTVAAAAKTASLSAAATSAAVAESACAGADSGLVHILPPPPPFFDIVGIFSTQGHRDGDSFPCGVGFESVGLVQLALGSGRREPASTAAEKGASAAVPGSTASSVGSSGGSVRSRLTGFSRSVQRKRFDQIDDLRNTDAPGPGN